MSDKITIDNDDGVEGYRPLIAWCLEGGNRIEHDRSLDRAFNEPGGHRLRECVMFGPVGLDDVLSRFTLPRDVTIDRLTRSFRDTRLNISVQFFHPPRSDAQILSDNGATSLGDAGADAALAYYFRSRDMETAAFERRPEKAAAVMSITTFYKMLQKDGYLEPHLMRLREHREDIYKLYELFTAPDDRSPEQALKDEMESVSGRIYDVVSASDLAMRLDEVMRADGARPMRRFEVLAAFKAAGGQQSRDEPRS